MPSLAIIYSSYFKLQVRWRRSFTRITYLSKLIGTHSLAALQGSNEPCPEGPTRCVVQHACVLSCNSNYFGYKAFVPKIRCFLTFLLKRHFIILMITMILFHNIGIFLTFSNLNS
ncbi:hypothetical protein DFO54_102127 [Erwinia sp. AG740]|nr:hypothetical protein DFO54_102127 [Erwinia sp. AG740]